MINGYSTVRDIAEKWNMTPRSIQQMCAEGRIKGAVRFGRAWAIPDSVDKPFDNRCTTGKYIDWRINLQKNNGNKY